MDNSIHRMIVSKPAWIVLWVVLVFAPAVPGGDIDLLRFDSAKPYLFVLFDTSASMGLGFDGGGFDGGGLDGRRVHAHGDDPRSKIRLAKEVLYDVLASVDGVHVGFASYDQAPLRVTGKGHLYSVADTDANRVALGRWPIDYPRIEPNDAIDVPVLDSDGHPTGDVEVQIDGDLLTLGSQFGESSGASRGSCAEPLHLDRDRGVIQRLALLGADGTEVTDLWIQDGHGIHRLTVRGPLTVGDLGRPSFEIHLTVETLDTDADACDGPRFVRTEAVSLELLHYRSFAVWDEAPDTRDSDGAVCGIDLEGRVPLHGSKNQRELVLRRLAPNHPTGGTRDFGIAGYFQDIPNADGLLEPIDPSRIPLVASGGSPLAEGIADFRARYAEFQDVASVKDSLWACRRPHILLVTDGGNNCSGADPRVELERLYRNFGVRTWVFHLGSDPDEAQALAEAGGGRVFTVGSKADLRRGLQQLLGTLEEETRTFATAAVPPVRADADDTVYWAEFTPLEGQASWDGHVRAFRKPLPLRYGAPDIHHPNHLWDAGRVLVDAAPVDGAVTVPVTRDELRVGPGAHQRRIYYPMAVDDGPTVPRLRQLLAPPTAEDAPPGMDANAVREDLWRGLGLVDASFDLGTASPEFLDAPQAAIRLAAHALLEDIYVAKSATVDPPEGTSTEIRYVLGDSFHSNPQIIGGPVHPRYYARDLLGYRAFAERQHRRRRILLVGANDGFLHGFDAGVFRGDVRTGAFDHGTGRELFAIAPRALLPVLGAIHGDGMTQHRWGVDGTPTVADAHLDVEHAGTPTASDRTWRTVAVTGLRRGGHAYVAVDLTEPDPMVPDIDPVTDVHLGFIPQVVGNGDMPAHGDTWPSILWEFTDPNDEDGNGAPDLGQTWSTPGLGAIRVLEDGEEAVKFVAVFGGGLDPSNRRTGGSGNWLYMVDLETGTALYKRRLRGAAPADVAAVDTDQDGFLDRIYIGDLAGHMYRANIGTPRPLVPGPGGRRVTAGDWSPRVIFDTGTVDDGGTVDDVGTVDGGTSQDGMVRRPIFMAPSVLFVAQVGDYALAFGTGDRGELWSAGPADGERFYVFVDDSARLDAADLPMTEAHLTRVAGASTGGNPLTGSRLYGTRGWYLVLDGSRGERVVTAASAVAGLTMFSTFLPDVAPTGAAGSARCVQRGSSRSYGVLTASGNPALEDDFGNPSHHQPLGEALVSEPFFEQAQTRHTEGPSQPLTERQRSLMDSLKQLYPDDCRFRDGYRFDIKALRSDQGVVEIVPLPVCVRETQWTEH